MPAFDADAIVIGGGPAGLAAAIGLGRSGCRVIVVERRTPPLDKPCGEGLMPTGLAQLAELGVDIAADVGYPFRGIRYVSRRGTSAVADFPVGPGRGIRRTVLSSALLARASRLETVSLRFGTRAEVQVSNHVAIRVGTECLHAPLIVGADGLHSKVRTVCALTRTSRRHWRWGMRQHFAVPPWSDYVEVHWGAGVEAYVTPVGPEEVGLAFLWDRRFFRSPASGALSMASLLAMFPELASRLAGSAPTSAVASTGPLEQRSRRPTAEGVALIGDAGGYLDAITGEGLSLAFAQALALERAVATQLPHATAPLTTNDLSGYAEAHRHIARPYKRMTSLVLLLSRYGWLAERAVGLLRAQPKLFEHFLMANMGLVPASRFWR